MIWLRSIVLALVVIAGVSAWGLEIAHCGYDYDEVQRAHSIWMTSQGLLPYQDFFECHPPYFAFLAPLVQGYTDPVALLLALRLVAALGNLLFLAGLATVAAISSGSGRFVAILGTVLVAFHPAVLAFLEEFRIDGWGYALASWSIVWFLRSRWAWRHMGFGIGTGIATLFFCPKLALLPPMILVVEQIRAQASSKGALLAFAKYTIGVGVAGGLFWCWLAANGISLNLAFACLVNYNSLSNIHSAFSHGLLREIVKLPTLSLPILAAFVIWMIHCIRVRSVPGAYPAALVLWLAAQTALVSYPYKQYYGPWFLFASGFFAFFHPVWEGFTKRAANVVFFGLCGLSISASVLTASTWMNSHASRDQGNFLRALNEVTDPEDWIVTMPPLHPIFRHDTFYVWCNTLDPAGYVTEKILEEIPLLRDCVSERHYREELEAHPPVLIVLWYDTYPQHQKAVLDGFIQERGYVHSVIGNVPVAIRPDRFVPKPAPD
jgi:hypothetical protein